MNTQDEALLVDMITSLTKELFIRYPEGSGACLMDGDKLTEIQRQAFIDGAMWFGEYAKMKAIGEQPEGSQKSKWMQRMEEMQARQAELLKKRND